MLSRFELLVGGEPVAEADRFRAALMAARCLAAEFDAPVETFDTVRRHVVVTTTWTDRGVSHRLAQGLQRRYEEEGIL